MEDEMHETDAACPRPSADLQAVYRRQYAVDAALRFATANGHCDPVDLLRLARQIDAFVRGES